MFEVYRGKARVAKCSGTMCDLELHILSDDFLSVPRKQFCFKFTASKDCGTE